MFCAPPSILVCKINVTEYDCFSACTSIYGSVKKTVKCSETMIERLIRMEDVDGLPK